MAQMSWLIKGPQSHVWLTVLAMGITLLAFADPIIGGIAASAYYLGREMAQAEERYLTMHRTNRENAPLYLGFLPESWNRKSMLDWMLPLVITLIVILLHRQ